ncbi:UNVERIFIED_CONTAM: Retrovirus-related Pol polyprotein from transposon TNT 1-94 [Sesamum indicum]
MLVGDASNSKAKGKGARCWKRKKGKANATTNALSAPVGPVGMGKGRFVIKVNKITNSASWVLDTDCGAHISNDLQVLERNKKLSKDKVVLKLGDGKAIPAEAVGIVHLAGSDQVTIELKDCYYVPSMIKNTISISLLDNAACESCLKGMMTKKPFIGQSKLASDLLDLIHSDVYGPLNTQARGGFSYLITFTYDHSRYGYVYLMRYKFEAFGRFKEFRLEVENQTSRKIKTLRSDRGGENLSGKFLDYLDKNGILFQWTPPRTPQLNNICERRNQTLLNIVWSMMSFTELPLSFWGYAFETTAKLLNMEPSKSVAQTLYQIWHGKPASYKYLIMWGSPAYIKRLVGDKLRSVDHIGYWACDFIQ